MGDADDQCPAFIPKVIEFPEGISYQLLQPLTNFKHCHDGSPAEGRIVFTCKSVLSDSQQDTETEFVMKIKVQVPHPSSLEPQPGPSTTTAAELKVLESFRNSKNTFTPHLIAFHSVIQGPDGLLPGGYITYTVMTKMPGQTLLNLQYWSISPKEREEIMDQFIIALRSIHGLGIEPIDRGLRNVLWEAKTKQCSIIDFELWEETTDSHPDRLKELQRWGLARRPAPKDWWAEWNLHFR